MKILELDIGNSRIKWRLCDPSTLSEISQGQAHNLDELAANLADVEPGAIRACSVRTNTETEKLLAWCRECWSIEPVVAKVVRNCGGITNKYEDMSRLGIDRWLAMLAAYRRAGGPCVIVDAGTALTLDIVSGTGQHQGGYIVPGLGLMAASLEQNTNIRLSDPPPTASLEPGHATDAAVLNGTLVAAVSLVQQVLLKIFAQEPDVKLYLSGGDAEILAAHINSDDFIDRDNIEVVLGLVLDGLAIACPIASD